MLKGFSAELQRILIILAICSLIGFFSDNYALWMLIGCAIYILMMLWQMRRLNQWLLRQESDHPPEASGMVAFGGDISCESEPDQFTRFTLRFPRVSPAEVAADEARVLAQAQRTFSGKRVLVVDDVPALRRIARSMLEPLGLQVEEAEHGQQALEMLAQRPYDAMVLDLSMPVMDGYATAESIRAGSIPGLARLPIVVYTAEAPEAARAKLERVGIDDFIGKPCTPVELAEALIRAQERARRGKATDSAAVALAGRRILIVDDEAFSRRYLRVLLEERGVEVVEAVDGAAALRMLESEPVDAVITDLHMPQLDGIGLAQAVRASSLARKPPMMALSAREDAEPLAAARQAGIAEFVIKPAEPAELFAALGRMLGAHGSAAQPAAGRIGDEQLLHAGRLETLRGLGILDEAVGGALRSARALLDSLPEPIAARDLEATKEQLHALIGICGNIGAHALHQKLRAMHTQLIQHGQWPALGWHEELLALYGRTARALREQHCPRLDDVPA